MGALQSLLRDVTTPVAPSAGVFESYRAGTRAFRHRIFRIWFAVNLAMLSVVIPVSFVMSAGLPVLPIAINFAIVGSTLVAAIILLPRCRSALAEDLVVLMPCLTLLLGSGIGCVMLGAAVFDRHLAFNVITICSAVIFLSAAPRVHVVLIASTLLMMVVAGVLAGMPRSGLAEDGVFWTAALLAFSWAGRMQERARYRMFIHRLERENQLSKVSAISSTLFRGARTDALTRVGNRLLLDERLSELSRAEEKFRDLWLLMVDVDHFKLLNDALGHPAGDDCLRTVAATLAGCLRADDMVARYGGEEFAVLVRAPEATEAWRIGERMREAVSGLPLANPHAEAGHVTVSIGIALVGLDGAVGSAAGGVDTVVARADRALYAAKGAGRDRVAMEPAFERTAYPIPGMVIPAI